MNIKEIFEKAEDGTLTYEQFTTLTTNLGAKFADLSDGKYVSKSKYDADIKTKDNEIESLSTTNANELETLNSQIATLNETIGVRDKDLADLQKKLEEAGNDATKLAEVTEQLTGLQTKYDNDVKAYEERMTKQAYDFAVKEFANTKKFSSQAAKRDFTQAMINKGLQFENGKLIGAEDFVTMYLADNDDAFYKEPEPAPVVEPVVEPDAKVEVPEIVTTASGTPSTHTDEFNFGFTGVRSKNK